MNLLSIGGSDPSSGAGIQGDIKTFGAHGNYGVTVVTAVTSQNTSEFIGAEPVSTDMLRSQLDAVLSDFEIDGIKIGMVYAREAVHVLAERLGKLGGVPIVVDPVMRSTTGGRLLEISAICDYVRLIVPLANVLTPNICEASMLASVDGFCARTPRATALRLQELGADSVVVTGIADRDMVGDMIAESGKPPYVVAGPSIPETNHGGGCTFSAALLCFLADGRGLSEAAEAAREFVIRYVRRPKKVAGGIRIAGAGVRSMMYDGIYADLANAIGAFERIEGIHECIPECQTNFVYAGPGPKTIDDVLGVLGRIVRAGRRVLVAGDLRYGGSKHVATALLAVNKKFPHVRSAMNIRYSDSVISAMTDAGFIVCSYDRGREPMQTKSAGSTIEWGVSAAMRGVAEAPDAVFHKGDYGKEAMILLFGTSPDDVLAKVRMSMGLV